MSISSFRPIIQHDLLRSFGRVKGRVLGQVNQQLVEEWLPKVLMDDVTKEVSHYFDKPYGAYRMEIGFGGGERLAQMAKQHPDIGFIGCEPYLNGIVLLLRQIKEEGLTNIRIFRGDARILLQHMPKDFLQKIEILFADPWPKRKHHKKRLISGDVPEKLAEVLAPGGTILLATDHGEYAGWMLAFMLRESRLLWRASSKHDWQKAPEGWEPTRYQKKALQAGRKAVFFEFKKP